MDKQQQLCHRQAVAIETSFLQNLLAPRDNLPGVVQTAEVAGHQQADAHGAEEAKEGLIVRVLPKRRAQGALW